MSDTTPRRPHDRRPGARTAAALAGIGLVAVVAGGVVLAVGAPADAVSRDQQIGVCHRTASESNPYVLIVVPAEQASRHLTGTDRQHQQPVTWQSAGSWRGVPHQAGDPRLDYFASAEELAAGRCHDTEEETTEPDPEPVPTATGTGDTTPVPEPTATAPVPEPTGTTPVPEPTGTEQPTPQEPDRTGATTPPVPEPTPTAPETPPGATGPTDGTGGTGAGGGETTGQVVEVPRAVDAGIGEWSTAQVWGAGLTGGGVAMLLASAGVLAGSRRHSA